MDPLLSLLCWQKGRNENMGAVDQEEGPMLIKIGKKRPSGMIILQSLPMESIYSEMFRMSKRMFAIWSWSLFPLRAA